MDHLLLDDIGGLVGEAGVYGLLVQGNLTVRYIYNENTDGAVHLVVSDQNYVWHGDYAYQFRQADDEHNGEIYPPQLVIYWEHPETEGDYESYTFRIETNAAGEKALRAIYRESEQKPSLYIDFTEIERVYKAIWLFRRIATVVPLLNKRQG